MGSVLATGTNSSAKTEVVAPASLAELLTLPLDQLEKVDIARIDLLCAEGLRGSENLDVEFLIRTLNGWAYHVETETKRNLHRFREHPEDYKRSLAYFRMGMMGTVLVEDMRIQYNPERERQQITQPIDSRTPVQWGAFFTDSRDVFIHGLVTGRHVGTCASMPFLYTVIGRRLGYPVNIAARKFHLYARYEEEDGKHLNVEATENQGFSTPSDEEYRNGEFPMTDEEIRGCGWLRPLSNKEILGICLLTRSSCLRSMKRYDEEITTRAQAARYLPDTPLMKRVNEKNNALSRNLQTEDKWSGFWDEVEGFLLPTSGPRFEYFQNRKLQTQLFMNQSTNLVEIEKSVGDLKTELARYRAEVSDDLAKTGITFGEQQSAPVPQQFLSLLADVPQDTRIPIPEDRVPPEYRQSIPWVLDARLSGLKDPDDIVNEMWAYHQQQELMKQDEQRREQMAAREEVFHVLRGRGISPPSG